MYRSLLMAAALSISLAGPVRAIPLDKLELVVAAMEAEEARAHQQAVAGYMAGAAVAGLLSDPPPLTGMTPDEFQDLRDLLIAGHVARAHDAGRADIKLDEVEELLPDGTSLDQARAAAAPFAARLDRLNVVPAAP